MVDTIEKTETEVVKELENKKVVWATGRRKTSVARVRLVEGTGKIIINSHSSDEYLGGHERHKFELMKPLQFIPIANNYDIYVNVKGGGLTGQVDAIKLGIARAFCELEPTLRAKLKQEGFLRRDPRMVERKKAGQPKARKKFQWTKR